MFQKDLFVYCLWTVLKPMTRTEWLDRLGAEQHLPPLSPTPTPSLPLVFSQPVPVLVCWGEGGCFQSLLPRVSALPPSERRWVLWDYVQLPLVALHHQALCPGPREPLSTSVGGLGLEGGERAGRREAPERVHDARHQTKANTQGTPALSTTVWDKWQGKRRSE